MNEEEFYNNIERWINTDISEWTHITLLAYFCYKYELKNKVRFRLVRSRKGVTLGKEAADFAKLFRTLAPENYADLSKERKFSIRKEVNLKIKNYINWMFDYKFRSGAASVNGTRIFLAPNIIVDFERMYARYLSKEQTTNKFEILLSWCQKEAKDIFDRHQLEREDDLRLIKRYADQYTLQEDSLERRVLAKAIEVGLLSLK